MEFNQIMVGDKRVQKHAEHDSIAVALEENTGDEQRLERSILSSEGKDGHHQDMWRNGHYTNPSTTQQRLSREEDPRKTWKSTIAKEREETGPQTQTLSNAKKW